MPHDVDTLVFPNYESLPEREDVTDPFLEVTLFKKNYAHVVSGKGSGQAEVMCCCAADGAFWPLETLAAKTVRRQDYAVCKRACKYALHNRPMTMLHCCRPVLQIVRCRGPWQPQLLHHLWQREVW